MIGKNSMRFAILGRMEVNLLEQCKRVNDRVMGK